MASYIRRRKFLATLLGGAAAALPLAVRAQQPTLPVIGFLHPSSPDAYVNRLHAFRQGLKAQGFVEGENVMIEYRWAHERYERLPDLAAELVRRNVAIITTGSTSAALAAKNTASGGVLVPPPTPHVESAAGGALTPP